MLFHIFEIFPGKRERGQKIDTCPLKPHGANHRNAKEIFLLRDGPLENLWGGGGAGEVQKKYSRKGKLNEKKFMQAN